MKILIFILLAAWILAYAAGIGVFIGDDRDILNTAENRTCKYFTPLGFWSDTQITRISFDCPLFIINFEVLWDDGQSVQMPERNRLSYWRDQL